MRRSKQSATSWQLAVFLGAGGAHSVTRYSITSRSAERSSTDFTSVPYSMFAQNRFGAPLSAGCTEIHTDLDPIPMNLVVAISRSEQLNLPDAHAGAKKRFDQGDAGSTMRGLTP